MQLVGIAYSLTFAPYLRLEESCLVRSGLVKLLDRLCSLVDEQRPLEVGGEEDDAMHRVTSLAWAAFQVRRSAVIAGM